jgi:hypothetical protein
MPDPGEELMQQYGLPRSEGFKTDILMQAA